MSMCFVVATPIGNLADLSPRAREVLEQVDLIASEDTRHSGRLLAHFGIGTPQISCHEFSSSERLDALVQRCMAGERLALITDAGTPAISDPGYALVRSLRAHGCEVVPVPGPSAVTAALSVSGLPAQPFRFCGFAPAKGKARSAFFEDAMRRGETQVVFEAPHRISDALRRLAALDPEREVFLGREITKRYEQYELGRATELAARVAGPDLPAKGEFVLVIAGAPEPTDSALVQADDLASELAAALPASEAAAILARLTGRKRRDCYALMESLKA